MNILEAYIKKNKKIIILLTGLDIKKINEIGDELSKDLKIDIIKVNELYDNNYLINLEDLDINILNDKIKDKDKYIITNFSNIFSNIKFDFSINIKFDIQDYIKANIENSKEKYIKYKKNIEKNIPNKFFKFDDITKTTDLIWDYLMNFIQSFLNKNDNNNNNNNDDNNDDYKKKK